MKVLKRVFQCSIVALLVLLMMNVAQAAGPLSFRTTGATAGRLNSAGNQQEIVFKYTVKNVSRDTYVTGLNHITVEVKGRWGNGRSETYKRKVTLNKNFNPDIGPGESYTLRTSFWRKVNPNRGWHKYQNVSIRILSYNWKGGKG